MMTDSSTSSPTYSISELASEFEMTTRAIRFYEDQGLLSPTRRGRTRIFSARDRVRVRLIQRGKRIGFSLKEIGEILDMYDDSHLGESAQLSYLLERIEDRRGALGQQIEDITDTLKDLDAIEHQCNETLSRLGGNDESLTSRINSASAHRITLPGTSQENSGKPSA